MYLSRAMPEFQEWANFHLIKMEQSVMNKRWNLHDVLDKKKHYFYYLRM